MNIGSFVEKTLKNKRGYVYRTYRTTYSNDIFELIHYGTVLLCINIKRHLVTHYTITSVSDRAAINIALRNLYSYKILPYTYANCHGLWCVKGSKGILCRLSEDGNFNNHTLYKRVEFVKKLRRNKVTFIRTVDGNSYLFSGYTRYLNGFIRISNRCKTDKERRLNVFVDRGFYPVLKNEITDKTIIKQCQPEIIALSI